MTYLLLVYIHLATLLPAFLIGTLLLAKTKGTRTHKQLGKIYMILMLATSSITLLMPANVGPRLFKHFGFIHLLSILVLFSVPAAYIHARKGNIRAHKSNMISLYIGGILIAGAFALMPGRLLNTWLLG